MALFHLVNRDRVSRNLFLPHDGTLCARNVDFLSRASGQIAIAIETTGLQEISELKDSSHRKTLPGREFAATGGSSRSLGKALR